MTDTTVVPPPETPPPPDFLEPSLPPEEPPDEIVRLLTFDEILRDHDRSAPIEEWLSIDPRAAPPLLGSGYTVTVANPTPPTNVSDVACGTVPHYTAALNPAGDPHKLKNGDPAYLTYTDDAALFLPAGAAGAITAIAAPVAGGSGPTSEATGTVAVVTAPGSLSVAPTQMISVQGNYTTTPNASHPSAQAPAVLPTITTLAPAAPVSGAGNVTLTVTGTGFRPDSIVYLAGAAQPTQFTSSTELKVMNAAKKLTAGAVAVTVVTGGTATAPSNWTFS